MNKQYLIVYNSEPAEVIMAANEFEAVFKELVRVSGEPEAYVKNSILNSKSIKDAVRLLFDYSGKHDIMRFVLSLDNDNFLYF